MAIDKLPLFGLIMVISCPKWSTWRIANFESGDDPPYDFRHHDLSFGAVPSHLKTPQVG